MQVPSKDNGTRHRLHRGLTKAIALLVIAVVIILGFLGAFYAIQMVHSATCVQSASSNVLLTVVNDSNLQRLQGVQVTGQVKWRCGTNLPTGNYIASENIGKLYTPPNGTLLIGSIAGNYSLILSYKGNSYPLTFGPAAEQNVNVTVGVPSNHVSIVGCTFGGGSCFNETNPNEVSMITQSSTNMQSLLDMCSAAKQPAPLGLYFGAVRAGASSPAVVCFQFYYYNDSIALTLNVSSMITIDGFHPPMQNGSIIYQNNFFNGRSNFTIEASQSQLLLGGPGELNEGALVAFALTAKSGASGTYGLGSQANYMLDSSEPVQCVEYGELLTGTGQPDYLASYEGGCITYAVTSNSSQTTLHTISDYPYPLLNGSLYFHVVGVINSTN